MVRRGHQCHCRPAAAAAAAAAPAASDLPPADGERDSRTRTTTIASMQRCRCPPSDTHPLLLGRSVPAGRQEAQSAECQTRHPCLRPAQRTPSHLTRGTFPPCCLPGREVERRHLLRDDRRRRRLRFLDLRSGSRPRRTSPPSQPPPSCPHHSWLRPPRQLQQQQQRILSKRRLRPLR